MTNLKQTQVVSYSDVCKSFLYLALKFQLDYLKTTIFHEHDGWYYKQIDFMNFDRVLDCFYFKTEKMCQSCKMNPLSMG